MNTDPKEHPDRRGTRYYTFEVNGRHTGLIRRTETSTGLWYERVDYETGRWIDEPNLIRHFYSEGYDLVPLDDQAAAAMAARYGARIEPAEVTPLRKTERSQ